MSSDKEQWFVEIVIAESWDGKETAPNVNVDRRKMDSVDDARKFVQKHIATLMGEANNNIELMNWMEQSVIVKFNYKKGNIEKAKQTVCMSILKAGENGALDLVDIGN